MQISVSCCLLPPSAGCEQHLCCKKEIQSKLNTAPALHEFLCGIITGHSPAPSTATGQGLHSKSAEAKCPDRVAVTALDQAAPCDGFPVLPPCPCSAQCFQYVKSKPLDFPICFHITFLVQGGELANLVLKVSTRT